VSETYSIKDVSRLFSLQEARLRYWAQTGFVGPSVRRGGRAYYTFQDLVGVKVAKELIDSGLPLQRVRKNLDALRMALPLVDRPLSQLRVCSDGDRLVVLDHDVAFEPHTGQLVMSFAIEKLSAEIADVLVHPAQAGAVKAPPRAPEAAAPKESPYSLFREGGRAEEARDPAQAEAHYRRALELDPRFAAAWTNLGNVLSVRGALGEARECYEKALFLDPEQPEARYNLANLLFDVGDVDRALAEYQRVLALCPEFSDAHFNLGLLSATLGDGRSARRHLTLYLEADPESEWAARAKECLQGLAHESPAT
jgi:tetratricopeptide (TPR) repeat protein